MKIQQTMFIAFIMLSSLVTFCNSNQGYNSGGDNFRRIEGPPGRGDMYVGDGYFYDSDSGCSVMNGEVLC